MVWQACAELKNAEIAKLHAELDAIKILSKEPYMVGVEAGKSEFRCKLLAAEDEIERLNAQISRNER